VDAVRATAIERDHRLPSTQFGRGQAQQDHSGRHQGSITRVNTELVDPLAILIDDPIAIGLVNQISITLNNSARCSSIQRVSASRR